MTAQVDLIWLTENPASAPTWPHGFIWPVKPTPSAIDQHIQQHLENTQSIAWLFWHERFALPDASVIETTLQKPGNVWHAGLSLGMNAQPEALDFVRPGGMLNTDVDAGIESTSWRLSLEACLISTGVLKQMGSVASEFDTLKGASLDLGYRLIRWGVFVRYVTALVPADAIPSGETIPLQDEWRFILRHFGRQQQYWGLLRMILSGYRNPVALLRAFRMAKQTTNVPAYQPYQHPEPEEPPALPDDARVTVLIPTVERYPYLRVLLEQLREQTVPPHEIIIVDQTPLSERQSTLPDDFTDLPIIYIEQDEPGQCTSRNAGLQRSTGNYVLFIDDDDEIEPDLIEQHLRSMVRFNTSVSSGAAQEPTTGDLPYHFTYVRASDVFPTNNTMIRREVLYQSGLFDLAYNRGVRADGDLGMRIYLAGTYMVYNPEISVLHHHAPRGGLRKHKARVVTYGKARGSLFLRRLPNVTEIYLSKRYSTPRQIRESLWMTTAGTFAIHGGKMRKLQKAIVALFQLPDTIRQLRAKSAEADDMLRDYPQIPVLDK